MAGGVASVNAFGEPTNYHCCLCYSATCLMSCVHILKPATNIVSPAFCFSTETGFCNNKQTDGFSLICSDTDKNSGKTSGEAICVYLNDNCCRNFAIKNSICNSFRENSREFTKTEFYSNIEYVFKNSVFGYFCSHHRLQMHFLNLVCFYYDMWLSTPQLCHC